MFRILTRPEGSKLVELSIKQRDMLLDYERDKAIRLRPPPIIPVRLPPTPHNTPIKGLKNIEA